MQLLQELLYNGNKINLFLSTEPIMFGLMNIIIVSTYKAHTLQVIYYFNKIPKSNTHNSDLHNLIPCELDLTFTPFCDKAMLTYEIELLPSGRKLVLIYQMMKILQSHISLIQPQINQPVINFQHTLKETCVSYISMGRIPSQIKVRLIDSTFIKIHMKTQGQYQSMQKEEIPYNRSRRALLQVLSSQTCSFTS